MNGRLLPVLLFCGEEDVWLVVVCRDKAQHGTVNVLFLSYYVKIIRGSIFP